MIIDYNEGREEFGQMEHKGRQWSILLLFHEGIEHRERGIYCFHHQFIVFHHCIQGGRGSIGRAGWSTGNIWIFSSDWSSFLIMFIVSKERGGPLGGVEHREGSEAFCSLFSSHFTLYHTHKLKPHSNLNTRQFWHCAKWSMKHEV